MSLLKNVGKKQNEKTKNMIKVVLDASALLAFTKNESGAERVEEFLGHIIMSSVNISEVAAKLLDSGMSLHESHQCILPFVKQIILFDEQHAFLTASLKKQTKHLRLSLGDRACISLGIEKKLPIYTADKIWKELEVAGADIRLIR